MNFLNILKAKSSSGDEAPVITPPILPTWESARAITAEEAAPGNLPIGWYVWAQGNTYYGLKPNEARTGLTASCGFNTLSGIRNWLGVPLPLAFAQEAINRLKASAQEAKPENDRKPLFQDTERPQNTNHTASGVPHRRRSNETHVRFTEEEFRCLQDRIAASCLPQSVFMRQAVLTGEIKADPHRDILIQEVRNLNAELRGLRGDCGKLGGLLKKAIKPNEEQKAMNPEEWEDLIHNIHALFGLQKAIDKTMEKINGYFSNELQ